MIDSLAERWRRLEPHVRVLGPEDDAPRPAVLLFHGCGGLRDHIDRYARAAAREGFRAFVIDSFAARGWDRNFALGLVCTGIVFRGTERAGDVLAAVWGVSQRPDVDADRLALAGWSHGGWAIMDLMALNLDHPGAAGLADPQTASLEGVKGLALYYPYVGIGALSRLRQWRRKPRVLGVIARHDHLSSVEGAETIYRNLVTAGVPVETWIAEGTHAFDELGDSGFMRHDPVASAEGLSRFRRFLGEVLA